MAARNAVTSAESKRLARSRGRAGRIGVRPDRFERLLGVGSQQQPDEAPSEFVTGRLVRFCRCIRSTTSARRALGRPADRPAGRCMSAGEKTCGGSNNRPVHGGTCPGLCETANPGCSTAHLLHTEVLCGVRSLCSSQEDAPVRMLGTGLGDTLRDDRECAVSRRGNKKGHLLAFSKAL